MKTIDAKTIEDWRQWLAEHHDSESEIWLVFHKVQTGVVGVEYADALDEALCFGWVDSLVKRLDERRYARKFTPRREDSRWSAINRKRYGELKASGRLQAAGVARGPAGREWAVRPKRYEMPAKLPGYIAAELKKHPAARRHFEALAPSHRRQYLGWIETAKREETRLRRLKEAIERLSAGKELGLK
jgi:uncharacterized protein YdeI (YjbR/CyaY-like superfamily)